MPMHGKYGKELQTDYKSKMPEYGCTATKKAIKSMIPGRKAGTVGNTWGSFPSKAGRTKGNC